MGFKKVFGTSLSVCLLVALLASQVQAQTQTGSQTQSQLQTRGLSEEPRTLTQLAGVVQTPVAQMSSGQKSKYLGVNLLRLVSFCSVSSITLAATAVGETIPMLSALTGLAVDLSLDNGEMGSKREFDLYREKDALHQVGGGAVSFVTDVVKIANHFLTDNDGESLAQAAQMKNSKAGYAATATLAKRFYGEEGKGECGKAGRAVVDVLGAL